MPDPTTASPMITDAVQGSPAGAGEMPWLANIPFATWINNLNLAQQEALEQQQEMFQVLMATAAKVVELMPGANPDGGAGTGEEVKRFREMIAGLTRPADGARAAASAPAAKEPPDAHPVTPHPAVQEFLAMLDRMNAITLRQSIRVVELAAVGAIVARALQVNTADAGAQEQVALWTGLMGTVIRDFGAWAESIP